MNAVAAQRHAGPLLPQINPNSNNQRGASQHSRMKQGKREGLQTGSDESPQILSKAEISQFRNSLKQNMCVEMLQGGFHRSFSELFSLLSVDQDRRAATDSESAVSLEEQRDKLETMRLHLSQAEEAGRRGSWTMVCDRRLFLGQYFSAPEDQWLSLHFYHSCAETERAGRSRPATEARAHLAETHLQQGELEEARRQAELCIQQAEEAGWLDLAARARQALWRIYSRMVDRLLDAADYSEALTLLHMGYSMATETEDKQMEGQVSYQLGLTYQRTGDHDAAKQFFNTCMQICGTLQDSDGLVKSSMAMAKSIESEGNTHETVQWMEELVDISRSNGLECCLADGCMHLGKIYFIKSQYHRASEFLLQSYEAACNLKDETLLRNAQVLLASARAHALTRKHSADVESATPAALSRLVAWKKTGVGQRLCTDSTGADP